MGEDCTARDYLAYDRTRLANERTFLAYIRTGLSFFVLGGFLIKFFPSNIMILVGVVSIAAGACFLAFGLVSFRYYDRKMKERLAPRKQEYASVRFRQ